MFIPGDFQSGQREIDSAYMKITECPISALDTRHSRQTIQPVRPYSKPNPKGAGIEKARQGLMREGEQSDVRLYGPLYYSR